MITYKTIDAFTPGLIHELLKKSYAGLIEYFPAEKERFYSQWEEEDRNAFANPETIGKYLFFSCLEDLPVGYFSWDDRQYPVGIIGQNCILPEYQRQGYGIKQIELIIKIFKEKIFKEIRVITGEHEFFLPTRRMYGFKERRRMSGDLFELVELYRSL